MITPLCYKNWQEFNKKVKLKNSFEFNLITDAKLLLEDDIQFGPYTLKITQHNNIELIIGNYANIDLPENIPLESNYQDYHGGHICDEVTSLMSLILGIRLKASIKSLSAGYSAAIPGFEAEGYGVTSQPRFYSQVQGSPRLPRAIGNFNLIEIKRIETYIDLSPSDASAILKSARLYQDSLWIAESNPELSWLLLVTSIESISNYFYKKNILINSFKEKIFQILFNVKLRFMKILLMSLKNYGSAKRFRNFIVDFKPDPLYPNIEKDKQISWSKSALRKSIDKIYDLRSLALHVGIPFPKPMCRPPRRLINGYEEKPIKDYYVIAVPTAIWHSKDLPMHLHTFEYIVRSAILNLWIFLLKSNYS